MQLTDTHCHLYLEDFRDDIDQVMKRGINEGVHKYYLPNIDSTSIGDLLKLEASYPDNCFAMMGLHPCSVKEGFRDELKTVQTFFSKRKFAGVGETGLDFYWDKTFIKEQYYAFETQILMAAEMNIPVIIHSRNSLDECIETVKKFQNGNLKGIFHCFGGTVEQAHRIIDIGFFLGIGGVLTYKKSGLGVVLNEIDLEHVVLETDAPYLTPVPFRGKRNESSYLKYIVTKLAEIKKTTEESIATITTSNAEKVFSS